MLRTAMFPRCSRAGLPLVMLVILNYYTSLLLQYKRMTSIPDLLLTVALPPKALAQRYNPHVRRMARISAALRSHVHYWNAQPEQMRYHLADAMSPWSKSCHCYAPWLNATSEDVCQEIIEEAGTSILPFLAALLPCPLHLPT
jgi:hypothetical protein